MRYSTNGRLHFTFWCLTNPVSVNRLQQKLIPHIASFLARYDESRDFLSQSGADLEATFIIHEPEDMLL